MTRRMIYAAAAASLSSLAFARGACGPSMMMRGPTVAFDAREPVAASADFKELQNTVKAELQRISDDLSRKAEESQAQLKQYGDQTAELKNSVDKALTEQAKFQTLEARLREVEQAADRKPGGDERLASVGHQLIANEELKSFKPSTRNSSLRVPVKMALYSAGLADNIVAPERDPAIVPRLKQRLFVRDLIPAGRTTSPAIWWVQQTGFTNNAAVVSEGVRKPESTITFALKTTPVATIAHIFKAAKQLLDDFTDLQSTVDDELRYGLRYAEEQEILFGDGEGVSLYGIVPQASDYAPSMEITARTQLDDLRDAMLQSQLARLPASGIVMHMRDWAEIETTKDSTGRYIIGDPRSNLTPSLWGRPVVETEIDAFDNKFLVGAFAGGAMIKDREDANVVIATENEDDFVKNMITIRCEERLALQVKRPEAFIYGQFTSNT